MGCVIGGGTLPAQAVLYSRFLYVFELPADSAKHQANFYASMFFLVALANLFAYFIMGWSCNVIGQAVTHRYRWEMFERVLRQDVDFFEPI